MQTLKPTMVENLFFSLFNLEPERPMYYMSIYRVAKNIFINCDMQEKLDELDALIWMEIERPYKTTYFALVQAYYNPRFLMSRKAFCKIGDAIEHKKLTRYEIMLKLEKIKDWILDECSQMARNVRFTAIQQVRM
jgi:hypothetical protein